MDRMTTLQPAASPHPLTDFSPPTPPLVWCVGAHGGAGTTFLASSLAPAFDCGQSWPVIDGDRSPFVVIVARETMSGLDAAADLLRQWHTDDALAAHEVLGVVLMPPARARRVDREVRGWATTVSGIAPEVWRLPWVAQWPLARASELPEWWPGDIPPKKRRSTSDVVPYGVAELGQKIVDSARIYLHEKENTND
ncbi:DUF6668 family protein [Corynebacterium sp. CCM 9203]|uniref:DUF6668 family protein n=1 Tax=Corynebacterium sp. CCM 9203 TaxID=3057615 RepID=UPI0035239A61